MAITPRVPLFGEVDQLVARAALLERGGELQVLELQEDLGADDFRQGARFDAGRVEHLALQARRGALDVLDSDHGVHCGLESQHPGISRSLVFPKPKLCVMVASEIQIPSLEVA